MKLTKEAKGITVISLLITIIVLLVIAGVAISQIVGEKTLDNAQVAVDRYNEKKTEVEALIGQLDSLLTQMSGQEEPNTTPVELEKYEICYDSNWSNYNYETVYSEYVADSLFEGPLGNGLKEWNTEYDGSGDSYLPGDPAPSDVEYLYAIWGGTYAFGQEVLIGTERFYVIKDEGPNATNVTLLAEYNISTTPDETTGNYYQQPNASYEDTACAFSSTVYWPTGETVDLNEYTTSEIASTYNQTKENNAIMRARDYATSIGGPTATGRLLTRQEANYFEDDYDSLGIICGTGQLFWIAEHAASYWNSDGVTTISGSNYSSPNIEEYSSWSYTYIEQSGTETIENTDFRGGYSLDFAYGVRPVITVPKTAITSVAN